MIRVLLATLIKGESMMLRHFSMEQVQKCGLAMLFKKVF